MVGGSLAQHNHQLAVLRAPSVDVAVALDLRAHGLRSPTGSRHSTEVPDWRSCVELGRRFARISRSSHESRPKAVRGATLPIRVCPGNRGFAGLVRRVGSAAIFDPY